MQASSRVIRLSDGEIPDLATRLRQCACGEAGDNRLAIMTKDVHLLESALAPPAGKAVISADEAVRFHFIRHVPCDARIGMVVWVNPEVAEHRCLDWLRAGAKLERARQLRRQQSELSQS